MSATVKETSFVYLDEFSHIPEDFCDKQRQTQSLVHPAFEDLPSQCHTSTYPNCAEEIKDNLESQSFKLHTDFPIPEISYSINNQNWQFSTDSDLNRFFPSNVHTFSVLPSFPVQNMKGMPDIAVQTTQISPPSKPKTLIPILPATRVSIPGSTIFVPTVVPTLQTRHHSEVTIVKGETYNSKGYKICGVLNKFGYPCQRLGTKTKCPFHSREGSPDRSKRRRMTPEEATPSSTHSPSSSSPSSPDSQDSSTSTSSVHTYASPSLSSSSPSSPAPSSPPTPEQSSILCLATSSTSLQSTKDVELRKPKEPSRRGWTKEEHIRFLKGLQMYGKGSWKNIAQYVRTRTPSQIQAHANRYFQRQLQETSTKTKKSIHDITLSNFKDLEIEEESPSKAKPTNSQTHELTILPQQYQPQFSPQLQDISPASSLYVESHSFPCYHFLPTAPPAPPPPPPLYICPPLPLPSQFTFLDCASPEASEAWDSQTQPLTSVDNESHNKLREDGSDSLLGEISRIGGSEESPFHNCPLEVEQQPHDNPFF